MRVKAVIAYDGSAYYGFQKQKSTAQTITTTVERVLHALKIDSCITGSGRTDAGVHATGQVIHFDLPPYWDDLQKLQLNMNRKLTDIRVKHLSKVSDNFHARFSAKKRTYRYVFKTQKPSVFEQKYVSEYSQFDPVLLQEALQCFKGSHDFDYFRKTGTQTHTSIRKVYSTHYIKRGDYHYIYFSANSFLRSQVRMMVDAAMQAARGKLGMDALQAQLACKEKHTTRLAPAEGLYLARILY
ncbi:MAG TPA: tRNA pseudouridine(38-40) synthase TruA [Epsilonproteobacteria bacterium]|nr:tRNA pseudouridine(38-40) synthase TruA [Campylobacterota bacterium]